MTNSPFHEGPPWLTEQIDARPLGEVLERRRGADRPAWVPDARMQGTGIGSATERAAGRERSPTPAAPETEALGALLISEYRAALDRLSESLEGLETAAADAKVIDDLVSVAAAMAEAILDRELMLDRDVLRRGIEAGLEALAAERPVRVRVSPLDFAYLLETGVANHSAGVRIVEDQRLERGRVLIESETRALDVSPGTQLQRFVAAVKEALAEQGRPSLIMRLIGNGEL